MIQCASAQLGHLKSSRGSIVQNGHERPETLSITTKNQMRRDEFCNTQYIKGEHQHAEAAFKTPGNLVWTEAVIHLFHHLKTQKNLSQQHQKDTEVAATEAESTTKSSKFLQKFLRSSFSQLILKDKAKMVKPMSLPFFGTISISSTIFPTWSVDDNDHQQPDGTPDTK